MGLSKKRFWNLCVYEYVALTDGYYINLERHMMMHRETFAMIYNTTQKRGKTPQQLYPLSIDPKMEAKWYHAIKPKQLTKEQIIALKKRHGVPVNDGTPKI